MATLEVERMADTTGTDWPWSVEILPLGKWFVDEEYQRPLTNFVDRIIKRFDPALVGTPVLSKRKKLVDGRRYAIIDGQTRWVAMETLEFGQWPAIVFEGLSQAQEADLFARLQKERRGVLSYHRFRSDLVAQKPEALSIKAIVDACGYQVGPSTKQGTIPAVAALEASYRRGGAILERTLVVFREAWSDRWMPGGGHLRGLSYFLVKYPGIDDERLARRLSIISPEELNRRASAIREGKGHSGSADKSFAEVLEGVYGRLPTTAQAA